MEVGGFEVEILVVIFFPFAEDLVVEGLVAQEAQLEYELDGFLEVALSYFAHLLRLVEFNVFLEFKVVEGEEDEYFIECFDEIEVMDVLVDLEIKVIEEVAYYLDDVLYKFIISFVEVVL